MVGQVCESRAGPGESREPGPCHTRSKRGPNQVGRVRESRGAGGGITRPGHCHTPSKHVPISRQSPANPVTPHVIHGPGRGITRPGHCHTPSKHVPIPRQTMRESRAGPLSHTFETRANLPPISRQPLPPLACDSRGRARGITRAEPLSHTCQSPAKSRVIHGAGRGITRPGHCHTNGHTLACGHVAPIFSRAFSRCPSLRVSTASTTHTARRALSKPTFRVP